MSETVPDAKILLDVKDVVVEYPGKGFRAKPFRALKGVSLDIRPGETVGLVGESGSGKTTLGRAVLGLAPVTGGEILYNGRDIAHLDRRERRGLSSEIQVVFQDPYTSLNPSLTIEQILVEPLTVRKVDAKVASTRVRELLDQVSLPASTVNRYPNELSGGQRQRIAVARALALKPDVIVLDEAVSALDVLVQGQVLDLLTDLQTELGLTYLFITHDLAVVRLIADNVSVMQKGRVVEAGTTDEIFANPTQQYTRELLEAIPGANFEFGR